MGGATFRIQDDETPQFKWITRLVHPKFIFYPTQHTALGGISSIISIRIKQLLNMQGHGSLIMSAREIPH